MLSRCGVLLLAGLPLVAASTRGARAETLPAQLQGSWRIEHILPTSNETCWTPDRAMTLIGSTLTYRQKKMSWKGGDMALLDIVVRRVDDAEFRRETPNEDKPATFLQLGIRTPDVLEVDLQHEDADVTGGSTEVPGDTVLLADKNRIIVSACGVYYEAVRATPPTPSKSKAAPH